LVGINIDTDTSIKKSSYNFEVMQPFVLDALNN